MSAYNISGWIPFTPNTIVRNVDGRHLGRVKKVTNSVWIDVLWEESGWLEERIHINDLERALEVVK